MTRRLYNEPTPAISNAIDYYRNEYLESDPESLGENENEYIRRKLYEDYGMEQVGKRRTKPGRPPKYWYDSMRPKDIHSLLFETLKDKVRFILVWG